MRVIFIYCKMHLKHLNLKICPDAVIYIHSPIYEGMYPRKHTGWLSIQGWLQRTDMSILYKLYAEVSLANAKFDRADIRSYNVLIGRTVAPILFCQLGQSLLHYFVNPDSRSYIIFIQRQNVLYAYQRLTPIINRQLILPTCWQLANSKHYISYITFIGIHVSAILRMG
jgi:hypothetical protein